VPTIEITSEAMGTWKQMNVEIEWGFDAKTLAVDFDGHFESRVAHIGTLTALAEDDGTTILNPTAWRSRRVGDGRRGVTLELLYAPDARAGLDSCVTIWSSAANFTFRVRDLEQGPILIPEHNVFITQAGQGYTASAFVDQLAATNPKSLCQKVREHREADSWDEVMQRVRFSRHPAPKTLRPFPDVPTPPMQVTLSDEGWTEAWRVASAQLARNSVWSHLAFEVARVAHDRNLIGHHAVADETYQMFLDSPGAKSDGDYSSSQGALEWAKAMKHAMGSRH